MKKIFTDQFFDILLNLDENWKVIDVVSNIKQQEIRIEISYIGSQALCSKLDAYYPIYDHAPQREWRHLDVLQYKTYISCKLPRFINENGKVETMQAPWAFKHDRHTHLFESYVIDMLLATKNQTKTAKLMRCGFNLVNHILHNSTQRGMERRNVKDVYFEHLSIDEKSFKKGHHYITVLSHPESGCVLNVVENRTKESVETLFDTTLTKEQQSCVKTISMDMWKAFMNVTKEKMPQAKIVHDRFHLVSYLNKAIDQVRRREVKSHEELKNSRYALLKNEANLTDKQRVTFTAIKDANYEVSKAWQVCANFKDICQQNNTLETAFSLFINWTRDAIVKNIAEVTKVVTMFNEHLSGVVNALIYNQSNAMAERLNGKIQELKTVGKGYRKFENFRSAILFFYGGLSLYPLK